MRGCGRERFGALHAIVIGVGEGCGRVVKVVFCKRSTASAMGEALFSRSSSFVRPAEEDVCEGAREWEALEKLRRRKNTTISVSSVKSGE